MANFSPNSSMEDKQRAYKDFMAARRGDVTSKDFASIPVSQNQENEHRQYKTYADLAHEAQMGTRAPINHHNPGYNNLNKKIFKD